MRYQLRIDPVNMNHEHVDIFVYKYSLFCPAQLSSSQKSLHASEIQNIVIITTQLSRWYQTGAGSCANKNCAFNEHISGQCCERKAHFRSYTFFWLLIFYFWKCYQSKLLRNLLWSEDIFGRICFKLIWTLKMHFVQIPNPELALPMF